MAHDVTSVTADGTSSDHAKGLSTTTLCKTIHWSPMSIYEKINKQVTIALLYCTVQEPIHTILRATALYESSFNALTLLTRWPIVVFCFIKRGSTSRDSCTAAFHALIKARVRDQYRQLHSRPMEKWARAGTTSTRTYRSLDDVKLDLCREIRFSAERTG